MSVIPHGSTKAVKVVYPTGCKEVTEDVGKDELVRRLKLIARAFQDMGQDDNEQYSGLAVHLATDFFMDHPNKDVRLLVACCIADVFRIFAPEAPYRDSQHLKDIFMFLNKQLRGLEDPNSPAFKRYFYLLENLAWVKSFNICLELDDNQEIFCSLFQLMFSIINDKHTSKVKNFMLDMMIPLITEADAVSQELLDILLINVVEPHKTQNRQAYQLAKDILIRTSNALEPFVQAFFNNALMLGKTSESELSEHLYDLIYELNTISPSILLSVLPQLEFKLKSNEESERKSVTKILAKMFSDQNSNLAEQNKPLWNCFLGRFNDISITVRTVCVQSAQNFILYHPELVKDVVEQVKIRQHDPEETVRMEVVNTLLNIARKNFECTSPELIDFIKERTRDKRFKIRREALLGLGQLYKVVTGNEEISQSQLEKILFVKDKVFHAYYQTNPDDKLLVERIFNICLVPYTLPTSERMKRLYLLYSTLDDHAVKAFGEMMKNRHGARNVVRQLLDGLDDQSNNPSRKPIFLPRLVQLARTLPEPNKALEQMKKFYEVLRDDKRLRALMKVLVSPDCTCKKANDSVKDVLKKLGGNNPAQSTSSQMLYTTVKLLLERIAPVMVDVNSIQELVQHIDDTVKGLGTLTDGIDNAAEKGVQLLLCFSSVFPAYFRSEETFSILLTFLKDEDEAIADTTLQIFTNCGRLLQKQFPNIYSSLMPLLQHLAKIGNPKQAKHAVRCINAISENKEAIFQQVFEHLKSNLNPDSANYITAIVALGHIAQLCPEEFSASMKSVVAKQIVKELLMQDRTSGAETTESWCSEHLVTEETQAKIQAMKLLMRWLLGLKSNANNSGTSTLRLLYTVIVHEGDLMEKAMINKPELARLRLQAGCCLLRLAEEPVYADLITREHFQALALLINDSCFHVRLKFSNKLHKGLLSLRLPLEYMAIFSLAANDPMRERRTQIKKCIHSNITKRREYLKQNPNLGGKMFQYLPDYVMPYTIHLLSHDPDLKTFDDVTALKNIKECLWFIMEPLVSRSEEYNYHFFRRLIENIKQTRDAQGPEDEDMNKKLYAVCDVALGLLQRNLTNIVLKDTNVDPVLPSKLFTKPDKANINTQVYLPKDFPFEKKKGFHGFMEPQTTTYVSGPAGGQSKTGVTVTQEIIVESPGPVVNPNPTCPREPRAKAVKKNKSEPASSESSQTDASMDTSESPQEIVKPARRGRQAKTNSEEKEDQTPAPKRNVRKKKATEELSTASESESQSTENASQDLEAMETTQEGTEEESEEKEESMEESPAPPIKKRILKKKLADEQTKPAPSKAAGKTQNSSSSAAKGAKAGEKKVTGKGVVNGASKANNKRTTSEQGSDASSSQGPSAKRRKVAAEQQTPSKAGKVAAGSKKQTKEVVKSTDTDDSPTSNRSASSRSSSVSKSPSKSSSARSTPTKSSPSSSPSSESSSKFKSPSLPAPKASPKKKPGKVAAAAMTAAKKAAKSPVTRRVLKVKSPSPKGSSSDSSVVPSPSPKKGAKKLAAPLKKKPVTKATVQVKNVRRARSLANGTSDGDDTAGTDSSMSPAKSAALSKAIQKAGLGKEGKKTTKAKKK